MMAVLMPITSAADDTSGPPEIAGIERGIGLDHVLDGPPADRADRATERRDHAGRHRRFRSSGLPIATTSRGGALRGLPSEA